LEALYRVEAGGEYYAFTQFEAISAREAFPGFDEPSFKVPFDISIVVRGDHEAIANTPVSAVENLPDGMKRIRFKPTKPLPTYLVAMAVGSLDIVEAEPLPATAVRDRAVPLRGVTVRGKGEQLAFGLENTRGILEALESYFGVPYPYAKLDLIAVPDFGAGAMENAGAITYRESLLLIKEHARPQQKRRFFMVHAHELAHQWFGDLVTPVWWDDIWLNEAFATWMAFVALDIWRPEAEFRRDLKARMFKVMSSDSLISARQIRQPVLNNHDIANAFDGITYSKGGAVLSMFEGLLGRESFRNGVQNYVRKYAWGVATADDFIRELAAQSGNLSAEKVELAFRSFLEQPGLPLLQAELNCENSVPEVHLSQSRYLPLGSRGSAQQKWEIPVCLRFGNAAASESHCVLVDQPQQSFTLPTQQCPDFLMPNADGAGYYRWSLNPAGWNAVMAAETALNVEEMMALDGSLQGAFDAGVIDVPTWFSAAERLSAHTNWRIATAPMNNLIFLHDRIATPAQQERLKDRFTKLYGGQLDRVGLEAPADSDSAELQSTIMDFLAVRAHLEDLRAELKQIAWTYTGYTTDEAVSTGLRPDGANDNLVGIALRVAVEEDDVDASFSRHLNSLMLASDDPVLRSRAMRALARTPHADQRETLLELVFSKQIRDNEIYNLITPQLENPESREATWAWLQANLQPVLERVPEWGKGQLALAGRYFCDSDHRQEVEDFFGPLVEGLQGGPRSLARTLETVDLCEARANFHRQGLDLLLP
jgi:alanyl aminopeptidase